MANERLVGSICVSDIPQELFQRSEKNGKLYLNLLIAENKNGISPYGSTHYAKIDLRRDQQLPEGVNPYVGNFKRQVFGEQVAQQPAPQPAAAYYGRDGQPYQGRGSQAQPSLDDFPWK